MYSEAAKGQGSSLFSLPLHRKNSKHGMQWDERGGRHRRRGGLKGGCKWALHLQQVFVAEHVLQLGVLWHVLSVCEDDVALDGGELALHLGHKIDEGEVQHDVLILGMVDNVLQLLLKQPVSAEEGINKSGSHACGDSTTITICAFHP